MCANYCLCEFGVVAATLIVCLFWFGLGWAGLVWVVRCWIRLVYYGAGMNNPENLKCAEEVRTQGLDTDTDTVTRPAVRRNEKRSPR